MALSLKDIFAALDALSDQERTMVRPYLDQGPGRPSSESLSTLLATWDESISLQDADEVNRIIRQSRLSKTEPPTF